MRNVLTIILLLLLVSKTAYAEEKENNLEHDFGDVIKEIESISSDVFQEFGDKIRLKSMLVSCEDHKRAEIIAKGYSDEIIVKFVGDKMIERLEENISEEIVDYYKNNSVLIYFSVSHKIYGFESGFTQASILSRKLDKDYCRIVTDLYYESPP